MAEKKVLLTISERVMATTFLNDAKVDLETLSQILRDIQEVGLSPEDKVKCEWKETMELDEEGVPKLKGYTWNDEKGGEKEIALQDKTLEYLQTFIKEKDEKGEFTMQDKAVVTLKDKLK